jgi:hypothetical protein
MVASATKARDQPNMKRSLAVSGEPKTARNGGTMKSKMTTM